SNSSQKDSFYYERRSYKEVCSPYQFHDTDFFLSYRNTHGNSVSDQEEGHCQKDHYNSNRHISDQPVKGGKNICCCFGLFYLSHSIQTLCKRNQLFLSLYIIQIHIISGGVC